MHKFDGQQDKVAIGEEIAAWLSGELKEDEEGGDEEGEEGGAEEGGA